MGRGMVYCSYEVIPVKINEKLDFLMRITNTANNTLGKYLSFDASYISRIRRGKRSFPRQQSCLEPISDFFVEHIDSDYRQKLVSEIIGSPWPDSPEEARLLLTRWLSSPDSEEGPAAAVPEAAPAPLPESSASVAFFYGNSGKRQAVEQFLTELICLEKPPQLLLYSNEEFDWMYEDPAFAKTWAVLLLRYIQKGGRIRIAHTISRASGEMLVALQKWIPIYMTGAVEPYFYPKTLDRIFRKTMFIARGHSAVLASSVGEHTAGAMNCLVHDLRAVDAAEQEFSDFLALCRPLMQVYTYSRRDAFLQTVQKFHQYCENMITVRTTPSFYTMPKAVADSMTQRLHSGWLHRRCEAAQNSFREMEEAGKSLTEVLQLPAADTIRQGAVAFPMCDLFDQPGLFYTADEFAAHLDAMIERLKAHENYHVILAPALPLEQTVYVKEDMGVILVKTEYPSIAFAMNDQRMAAAFWDYLSRLAGESSGKEDVISRLQQLRESI